MEDGEPRRARDGRVLLTALAGYGSVAACLFLFVFLSAASPHFLTGRNLLNTVEAGAIYGIVALGLTVLFIVGEFDLCAGATFVLAGIVAAKVQPFVGNVPALTVGVAAGIAVGAVNGTVVAVLGMNAFAATLATGLIVVGIGTLLTNGFQLYVSEAAFGVAGNGAALGIPYFVWVFLGLAAAIGFALRYTRIGRWTFACGGNREAARLLGIDTDGLRFAAFVFSGFTASLAGVILVSRTSTAIAGNGFSEILFPAVAAVVIGGTSILGGQGAVWRTLVGVFFLELIRNGTNLLGLDPYYQTIVQGVVILTALGGDVLLRRTD